MSRLPFRSPPKKLVAVIGFYHQGNLGDDRLMDVIARLCEGKWTPLFLHHTNEIPASLLKRCHRVIIGGGGLVQRRVGIWYNMANWLRNIPCPIGVFGLGIPHLDDGLDQQVQALLERADQFTIRDPKSWELLGKPPKARVMPDLSWCFPLSPKKTGENVPIKNIAINLINDYPTVSPAEEWLAVLPKKWARIPFPMYRRRDWSGETYDVLTGISPLMTSDILLATRYHALVFALQMRLPFCAIPYDAKVFRLLEEADLSEFAIEPKRPDLLTEKLENIAERRDEWLGKADLFASKNISKALELREAISDFLNS